jgi:acyl dehydratase
MVDATPGGEQAALYADDLQVGQRVPSGTYRMDEEQMQSFAEQFDPRAFHLDADAAKGRSSRGSWRAAGTRRPRRCGC